MTFDREDPRWTAYALGELDEAERAEVEKELAENAEARELVAEIQAAAEALTLELGAEPQPAFDELARQRISVRPKRRYVGLWVAGGVFAAAAASMVFVGASMKKQSRDVAYVDTPQAVSAPDPGYYERNGRMSGGSGNAGLTDTSSSITTVPVVPDPQSTESYSAIQDNGFVKAIENRTSTFSIDVDTASYSNVRRFLRSGQLPPRDAVRLEELVNYFPYADPAPSDGQPFAARMEMAPAPWDPSHRLLRIGIKGREVDRAQRPDTNLVFLIDVSGSMQSADKLPLLVQSFKMLVERLGSRDRVAIVVYAGSEGLVLPSTAGDHGSEILAALSELSAGGSTNGGAGIKLAYDIATKSFIEGGVNRVILATDGDFNVGITSQAELVRLIQAEAKRGVFLTVLGFGTGNLQDATMEQLADKGNGQYAYIDGEAEARKVFGEQMAGTLTTIAKDVKLQLDFNPARVEAYRLIGYENRLLAKEDFDDDKKDAGEIGAGHSVTALYEVVPVKNRVIEASGELLKLKIRYKAPAGQESELIETTLGVEDMNLSGASDDLRFAAAVAEFGMLLRDSDYKAESTWDDALGLAEHALGPDPGGHRAEFLELLLTAKRLSRTPR